MEDWERRLYDSYISSGTTSADLTRRNVGLADRLPYAVSLIKTHLPRTKSIAIVDLGCGRGDLLYCLKELGYSNVRGVDISPDQVRVARKLGLEVECQEIGSFLRDKANHFDVVFLMDVLEHFGQREVLTLLDQVQRAMATGGLLLIHVPNAEGAFGMRVRYGDLTHKTAFTPQSIRQALNVCGFSEIECHEDKPIVHGLASLLRYVLWQCLTVPIRLLLSAETGATKHILSQNMTVTAKKTSQSAFRDGRR